MPGRIDKRQRLDEQRRKKRMQASGVWLTAAKVPPRPIVVAARRPRPYVAPAGPSEPLPAMSYPTKKVMFGKKQRVST